MNFFSFHMGDYGTATKHLGPYEDLFYRRLLDLYYADEQPPPADIAVTCRLVRARRPREKEAVQDVLEEFFTLTEAGWIQRRCEKEIIKFVGKSNRGRNGARVRWGGGVVQAEPAQGVAKGGAGTQLPPGAAGTNATRDAKTPFEHAPTNAQTLAEHATGNAKTPFEHAENDATNTNTNTNTSTTTNPNPSNPAVPVPDPPTSVGHWMNFFTRAGFDPAAILVSTKLRALMKQWIAQGVSQAAMREAMQIGDLRLNARPRLPNYYADIVDDLRRPVAATASAFASASASVAASALPKRRAVIEDI